MVGSSARLRASVLTAPLAVAMAVTGFGIGAVGAQDGTPTAGGTASEPRPGHIHAGACDQLGEVVFPLTSASLEGMVGTTGATPGAGEEATAPAEEAMGEAMGAEGATMVETSVTTVDAPLEDILAEEHAINFHESEENIQNYIACGELGGMVMTGPGMERGGTLTVGLRELNGSGYSGIAVIEGMDDQTEVSVYLARGLTGGGAAEGTPRAGGDGGSASQEIAVEIENFKYDPDPVEIAVGSTVTWTNQDGVPHTATAIDRDRFQSGTLNRDDSYTETFDEPGSYEYFCEFHAQMKGTLVVR